MFGGWGIGTDIFPREDAICIGEDMLLKGHIHCTLQKDQRTFSLILFRDVYSDNFKSILFYFKI